MSGTQLHLDDPITDAITRLRFAPNSNHLLISSWDSSIRLFDVESHKLRLEAQIEGGVLDCCFESDSVAYSAGSDGSVCRHDLQSGAYDIVGKHDDTATSVEYSNDTCQVITTGWDQKILSWDSRLKKELQCLIGFTSHVESISVCGFELFVASGSSIHKYDLRKLGGVIHLDELLMGISIRCVRTVPCCEGFAVGSVDGRVTLQSDSDKNGFTFRCKPKSKNGKYHLSAVNDIAFNPVVPGTVVTGDYDGYVIAWDARSRKRLLELPRYPNSVASLSYNHTGELLAIASSYTYQEANEIEDHPQIFIQDMGDDYMRSASAGSSCRR